jgi:hypothetical protein
MNVLISLIYSFYNVVPKDHIVSHKHMQLFFVN